jgi:hypothetical protein
LCLGSFDLSLVKFFRFASAVAEAPSALETLIKPRFSIRVRSEVAAIWDAVFAACLSAYRGYSDKNGVEYAPEATDSDRDP